MVFLFINNIKTKFLNKCCKKLKNLNEDNDKKEIKKCPKCGIDLLSRVGGVSIRNSSVVDQLPYKSPGTAALIAFIGGIFALLGLGHIYIGNVGRGIGILISGIVIYAILIITM